MIPPLFISHSHFDNRECHELVDFLRQHFPDISIFFDESALHGGDEWITRIQREVIARPYFIVILSRHSVVAEWVREETNLALSRAINDKAHRKVIPVLVDDGLQLEDIDQLAPLLTMRQIVDLTANDSTTARTDLLRVLRGEASGDAPRVNPVQLADLERARDLANQVHTDLRAGHWGDAVAHGKRAVLLAGNERDAALWGDLGVAYLHNKQPNEASDALRKALSFNKYRSDLWRMRATALAQLGILDGEDGAVNAWEEAEIWTTAPVEKLAVLAEYADALIAARRWSLADSVVRRALNRSLSDDAWLVRQRIIALGALTDRYMESIQNKDWQTALDIVSEALNVDATESTWIERRDYVHDAIADADAYTQQQQQAEIDQRYNARLAQIRPLFTLHLQSLQFTLQRYKDTPLIMPPTVPIHSGAYMMGGDNGSFYGTSSAMVALSDFYMSIFPVTVAEYACAVVAKAVPEAGDWINQQMRPDHPVVNVSWVQAVGYAVWLSQQTGKLWRLPTEAEWEFAARGTDGRIYPWGNSWDKRHANTSESGIRDSTPVGAYADRGDVSPFGVHEMAGNVWEWTTSIWQGDHPYEVKSCENNEDETLVRVIRGGSWNGISQAVRSASRGWHTPTGTDITVGFRMVFGPVDDPIKARI